jgi:predicted nucleic acid-binding protein
VRLFEEVERVRVLRIYIDTSVIGGCFDSEFAPWSNGLIRDFQESRFLPVVSEVVATEIELAPETVRNKWDEILLLNPELIEVTEEAKVLTQSYAEHGALPPKFHNDMLHIALATVADIDVLVSWNFKHIVRLDKIRIFNAVNLELGYKQLQIYSPREVTSYGK